MKIVEEVTFPKLTIEIEIKSLDELAVFLGFFNQSNERIIETFEKQRNEYEPVTDLLTKGTLYVKTLYSKLFPFPAWHTLDDLYKDFQNEKII